MSKRSKRRSTKKTHKLRYFQLWQQVHFSHRFLLTFLKRKQWVRNKHACRSSAVITIILTCMMFTPPRAAAPPQKLVMQFRHGRNALLVTTAPSLTSYSPRDEHIWSYSEYTRSYAPRSFSSNKFYPTNFNQLVAVMQTLLTSHKGNTYINLLSASDVRTLEGRGEKFLKGLTDWSCCLTRLHPQQKKKIAALQGVRVTRDERRDLRSCLEYGL